MLETGYVPYDDNPDRGELTVTGHVAYSPDGRRLASADAKVRVWDIAAGSKSRQRFMVGELKQGVRNDIEFVAFTADSKQVLSAQKDGTIRFWDADTGKPLRTLRGQTKWINAAAMTPDGARLVCGSSDEKVVLWDLVAGQEMQSFDTSHGVWSVAISPNGARVAAAGGPDNLIRIWEASTKK